MRKFYFGCSSFPAQKYSVFGSHTLTTHLAFNQDNLCYSLVLVGLKNSATTTIGYLEVNIHLFYGDCCTAVRDILNAACIVQYTIMCGSSLVWCRLLISCINKMKSRALILVLCMRYFFCISLLLTQHDESRMHPKQKTLTD